MNAVTVLILRPGEQGEAMWLIIGTEPRKHILEYKYRLLNPIYCPSLLSESCLNTSVGQEFVQ